MYTPDQEITPPVNDNESFAEMDQKSKANDLVSEAEYRLFMLKESKPKQSDLKFQESVLLRCETIRDNIYKYWDNL